MPQNNKAISFVIPVHNEAEIVEKNLEELTRFCLDQNIEAEIVLCENGSTDESREIINRLNHRNLRKIIMEKKGLGSAYRAGIKAATKPIIYFTGIDFPFGFQNILDCHNFIHSFDLVLASKAHPQSVIKSGLKRNLSSVVYRSLLKLFLGMKVDDPQGCAMFNREKILKVLKYCDSDNAFFSTQLALYGERNGFTIREIPVNYTIPRTGSKISVTRDGWQMFKQVLKERKKLKQKMHK